MSSIQSNFRDIARNIADLGDTLNLRRRLKGASRRVGDDLLDVTAVAIERRTVVEQRGPDGAPLAPLRPATIARKIAGGFPLTIGIQTYEMLDLDQVRGEQVVTDTTAQMTYGTKDTARAKAEKFQEGGTNQSPRFFYDLGREGEELIDGYIEDEVIAPYLDDLGA
jgi:hypothetical protein